MIVLVFVLAAVMIIIDQLIKYFVVEYLAPVGSVSVINNLFSLTYVENRGAAFGIMQNQVWFFAAITILLLGVFIYLLVSKKMEGKLFMAATALIVGGGVGNLIDRIFRGFVVDYLAVSFFPPVCNFADYCVVIGAVLFIISIFKTMDKKPELKSNGENNE